MFITTFEPFEISGRNGLLWKTLTTKVWPVLINDKMMAYHWGVDNPKRRITPISQCEIGFDSDYGDILERVVCVDAAYYVKNSKDGERKINFTEAEWPENIKSRLLEDLPHANLRT